MMTNKPLLAGWERYVRTIIPAGASAVQIEETRRAFYAGAAHLFQRLMQLEAGSEPTSADLEAMDHIAAELAEFPKSLR